jgi:hypothetical protein
MKTKLTTKITLGLALSFAIAGSVKVQAQTATPGGKLWGYAFGDFAYVGHGDSAGRGNGGLQYKGLGNNQPAPPTWSSGENAFDLRRVYLGYDYTINDKFSATTLLAYEGNADANGNNVPFLKNAYFTWKNIFPKSNLIVGQQPTSPFATANQTEALWGYRSVEKTIMDLRKVDGSTDMGIALTGKIWEGKADSGKM